MFNMTTALSYFKYYMYKSDFKILTLSNLGKAKIPDVFCNEINVNKAVF